MFINTDKIGLMATVSAKDWKGTTAKEDFDNRMAETAERQEKELRQDILDTLAGRELTSHKNRIQLEVHNFETQRRSRVLQNEGRKALG